MSFKDCGFCFSGSRKSFKETVFPHFCETKQLSGELSGPFEKKKITYWLLKISDKIVSREDKNRSVYQKIKYSFIFQPSTCSVPVHFYYFCPTVNCVEAKRFSRDALGECKKTIEKNLQFWNALSRKQNVSDNAFYDNWRLKYSNKLFRT